MKYKITIMYRLNGKSDRIPLKVFEIPLNHAPEPEDAKNILKDRLGSNAVYVKSYVQEANAADTEDMGS